MSDYTDEQKREISTWATLLEQWLEKKGTTLQMRSSSIDWAGALFLATVFAGYHHSYIVATILGLFFLRKLDEVRVHTKTLKVQRLHINDYFVMFVKTYKLTPFIDDTKVSLYAGGGKYVYWRQF